MSRIQPAADRVPALDGIRGIAILLVMVSHLAEQYTVASPALRFCKAVSFAGWTGVDLFFVLSGFRITGILFDSKGQDRYFRNFYGRRTLRIFPLYYVALVLIFVAVPAFAKGTTGWNSLNYAAARADWPWFAAYLVDVLVAWKGFLFGGHFWTLAVEEHFYLLWPLLVHRLNRRQLVAVSALLMMLAAIVRTNMILWGSPYHAIYVLTPCRMDGLAMGAFLALTVRAPGGLERLLRMARLALPVTAALWIVLMVFEGGWYQYGLLPQILGYEVTEFFYASMVVFALGSQRLAAAVAAAPLRFAGKISYALYVFHPFVYYLAVPYFALGVAGHPSVLSKWIPGMQGAPLLFADGLAFAAVALGLSVAAAMLSWSLLESRCLRLRRYFVSSKRDEARLAAVAS